MTTALQCFTTHACDHIDYKPPRAPPTHKLTIQHARRPPLMFKRKKKLTAHRRAVRRSEGIATPLGGFTPSADTSLRFYCLLKYLLTTGSLHSVPYSSDSLSLSFNTSDAYWNPRRNKKTQKHGPQCMPFVVSTYATYGAIDPDAIKWLGGVLDTASESADADAPT